MKAGILGMLMGCKPVDEITYFSMTQPVTAGDLDGLSVGSTIGLIFEKDIDTNTIAANIELLLGGSPVACNIARDNDPEYYTDVIITPDENLEFETEYILYVNTGLRSTDGSHIDKEYSYSFTTQIP